MKRDMDLVREILLFVEKHCGEYSHRVDSEAMGKHDEMDDVIRVHISILKEHGFLNGSLSRAGWTVNRLTWEGYELLDNIRDISRWSKIKAGIEKVGGFSMGVLQSVSSALASQAASGFLRDLPPS